MGQSNGKIEYFGILAPADVQGGDEIENVRARAVNSAQKKEDFIRSVAEELSKKLSLPALDPKGKSVEQILEVMKQYFPRPGNRFSDKADTHVTMCRIMANAINKFSGKTVLNVDSKNPEQIAKLCDDVIEFIHSLISNNFHQEYVGIKTEISTILGNLDALDEVMRKFHDAIKEIASKHGDPNSRLNVTSIEQAYNDVKTEHDRQMGVLRNLLDIKATDVEVDRILATTGELKNIVKDKYSKPGEQVFRDKIESAFSLYRNAAVMAKIIKDALTTVDLALKDYGAFTSVDKLSQHISQSLAKKLKEQGLSDAELSKFIASASTLMASFRNKDAIIQEISGSDEVLGGLKVDKRVDANKKLRMGLIRTFNSAVTSSFENFSISGDKLANKLMLHADPDNELLLAFIRAMDVLPSMQNRRIYVALTGYKPTVASIQDREIFISHARNLIEIIKKIEADKELGKISEFRDMRTSLESIIDTVDAFSKKFAKGIDVGPNYDKIVGSDEPSTIGQTIRDGVQTAASAVSEFAHDLPEHARAAAGAIRDVAQSVSATRDAVGAVRGSDEDNVDPDILAVEGGALDRDEDTKELIDVPEINKVVNMFDRTKTAIKYKFRISQLQSNMRNAVKELPNYKSEYGKVLGKAVAAMIDDANRKASALAQFEADLSKLTDTDLLNKMGDQKEKFEYLQRQYTKFSAVNDQNFTDFKAYAKSHISLLRQQQLARAQLYKVAEAVDLYIQSFSAKILEHPEALQGIVQILDNTEIASKWMSVKSSHSICKVFETFPMGLRLENGYDDNAGTWAPGHVGASNLFSYPVSGIHDKLNMDEYRKHYYAFVVSRLGLGKWNGAAYAEEAELSAITGDANTATMILNMTANHNLVALAGGGATTFAETTTNPVTAINRGPHGSPGNPYVCLALKEEEKTKLLLDVDAGIETGVLKNIISTFVTIGDKFGDTTLSKTSALSPIEIFKILKNHLLYSNFTMGPIIKDTTVYNNDYIADSGTHADANKTTRANTVFFTPKADRFVDLKEGATGSLLSPKESVRSILGIKMRTTNVRDDNLYGSGNGSHADDLYLHIIKAMVSKVFTAIGMYNTLNRPLDRNGLGYYTPLRMAIGADETVKVIPEAIELYVRLPLLAEWYREVIGNDTLGNAAEIISMLPDADGVFAGLIELVFDKLKYITNGAYSETDTRNLIIEINKIYVKYGDCRLAILDFVNEINRRIGVLDAATNNAYKSIKQQMNRTGIASTPSDEMEVNFKLSSIDESDTRSAPLPSDSYISLSAVSASSNTKMYGYSDTVRLLSALYSKIDTNFKTASGTIDDLESKYSFTKLIDSKHTELTKLTDPEERFRVIQETISALGQFSSPYLQKAYVMFHETVMYPLQVLGYISQTLEPFYTKFNTLGEFAKLLGKLNEKTVDPAPITIPADLDVPTLTEFVRGYAAGMGDLGAIPLPAASRYNGGYGTLALAYAGNYGGAQDALFKDNNVQYLLRGLFNLDRLLPFIFEQLYQLSATNLISVNVTTSDDDLLVSVSFSKLRDLVSGLLGDVKRNIEKFRGVIAADILTFFEELSSNNSYSLYKLENVFFNERLDGKYGSEKTLDAVANNINMLLRIYTTPNKVDNNFAALAAGAVPTKIDNNTYFNRLINTHHRPAAADFRGTVLGKILTNRTNAAMSSPALVGIAPRNVNPGGAIVDVAVGDGHILPIQPDIGFDSQNNYNKSIRQQVNQLLYAYLTTVYDESVHKVYKSTVEQIINSNVNYEFMDPSKAINSRGPAVTNVQSVYDVLAAAYREVYTQMSKTGDKHVYLTSDLLSLPTYYRERLACRLPYFKAHAEALMRRIDLARNVMRPMDSVVAAGATLTKPQQNTLMDNLNSILVGVINAITDTMTEINDQPVYLETNKNSVEEYKSVAGMSPFMPNSTLIKLISSRTRATELNGTPALANYLEVPMHPVGSAEFKLIHAARGLLGKQKYSLDEFTGFVKIMEDYNMRTKGESQFTKQDLDAMVDRVTQLNMHGFYRSLREFNRRMNSIGVASSEDNNYVMPFAQNDVNLYQLCTTAKAAGPVVTTLTDVLRLTEDTNQRSQIDKVANYVAAFGTNAGNPMAQLREILRVYNIVDANIVPINIHALQRELPFGNIYNASWIYDHYMEDLHELDRDVKANQIYRSTNDPKLMSYNLIKNPYMEVSAKEYFLDFHKMMVGNLGIEGLGRPRYLAEEIYNKPLFGELYANRDTTSAEESANRDDYDRKFETIIADFMSIILPFVRGVLTGSAPPAGGAVPITGLPANIDRADITNMIRGINNRSANPGDILPAASIAIGLPIEQKELDIGLIMVAYKAALHYYDQRTKEKDGLFEQANIKFIFANNGIDIRVQPVVNYTHSISWAAGAKSSQTVFGAITLATTADGRNALVQDARYAQLKDQLKIIYDKNSLSGPTLPAGYVNNIISTSNTISYPYYDTTGKKTKLQVLTLQSPQYKNMLLDIGFKRFNTHLIRNIIWLCNNQRFLRLKLRRELTWYDSKIVRDHSVTASSITEEFGNDLNIQIEPTYRKEYVSYKY